MGAWRPGKQTPNIDITRKSPVRIPMVVSCVLVMAGYSGFRPTIKFQLVAIITPSVPVAALQKKYLEILEIE